MKRFIYSLFAAVVAACVAMCAASCQREIASDGIVAGLPTDLTFDLVVPIPDEITITKATDEQETKVENIALLFYSGPSARPVVIEVSAMGTPQKVNNTNYIYTISCNDNSLVSGDWYLYAIGNYGRKNFGSVSLDEVRKMTMNQMKEYLVKKENDLIDMNEGALLLTGKFGRGDGFIQLEAGEGKNQYKGMGENYRIHLRRMTAKVSFTFNAGSGVTFTPTSYTIHNMPKSATLFEREGWTLKDGTVDNVNGTNPGELPYSGNSLADITANLSGNKFTFYMMENVGQPKHTGLAYEDREAHSADKTSVADQTFYNAPDNATYVTVTGRYSGPGAKLNSSNEWVADSSNPVTGIVSYTVHLGDFSTSTGSNDNFTVRRNAKYNYIVTINGVKNIIVEATTNAENQPGAEGDLLAANSGATNITLDSHYETVMVAIPAAAYDSYILRVNTPMDPNHDYSVISGVPNGSKPTDVSWIKFAKPKSKTEFNAYPGSKYYSKSSDFCGTKKLLDIFELFEEIKNFAGKSTDYYYYDSTTKNIYVAAYVDEYFYAGQPLSKFINVGNREMTWATGLEISTDKKSSYAADPIFSIKQKSIKTVYDLSATNPFGVESLEEINSTTSSIDGNTGSANSMTNGWANFTSNFSTDGSASWTTYVKSTYGHYDNTNVVASSHLAMTEGEYQCLSRNRDEDGDGKIDADEVKWYLPAHDELLTYWNGYPALDADAQAKMNGSTYYSSTNRVAKAKVWWADEGSAFGGNLNASYVRCARALKTYNAETTSTYRYNNDTRVVTMYGLNTDATRTSGSVQGEYIEHERAASADQLPQAFQIAKENCKAKEITTTATPVYVDNPEDVTEIDAPIVSISGVSVTYTTKTTNKKTTYSNYKLSCSVKITNFDSNATYGYSSKSSGTITTGDATNITLTLTTDTSTPASSFTMDVYPVVNGTAYNNTGTKTTITFTRNGSSPAYKYTATTTTQGTGKVTITGQVLDHYEYSTTITAASGNPGQGKYTRAQVLSSTYCQSSYYESSTTNSRGIPTDLGQWRTPNERELGIMMASVGTEKDSSPNAYALNVYTSAKSYYDRSGTHCQYFIQSNAVPFITTANESYDFIIRCVRDATPETVTE